MNFLNISYLPTTHRGAGGALLLAVTLAMSACGAQSRDDRKQASLEMFSRFHQAWEMKLAAKIKESGIKEAIRSCNIIESQVRADLKKPDELTIKRVTLKQRGETSAPDEFERKVLENWEQALANKKNLNIVAEQTAEGYRVMKPIIINRDMCLQCHGTPETISPEAAKELTVMYPKDQATGYKKGDIRGAFSAIWTNKK